jgi:hypothetical protein
MFSKNFRCNDCGSALGYRSRPRTFLERYVLPLFFMRPVRCGACFRRCYRLISTEVRDRSAADIGHHAAA